ncbi:hypothetical protein ACFQ3Z_09120 [Streptomyces nogalater]
MLPAAELAALADWQTGPRAEAPDALVHHLFARRAAATPTRSP